MNYIFHFITVHTLNVPAATLVLASPRLHGLDQSIGSLVTGNPRFLLYRFGARLGGLPRSASELHFSFRSFWSLTASRHLDRASVVSLSLS